MNIASFGRAGIGMVVLFAIAGCSSSHSQVFDPLGGMSRVNTLAERFVDNLAADGRTTNWLSGQDLSRLKSRVAEQVCAMTGGECVPPLTAEQITAGARKFDTRTADAVVDNFVKAVASLSAGAKVTSALNDSVGTEMPGVLGALLN